MKVEYTYFLLLKFYLDILRLLVSCPLMKGCNYGSTLKVASSGTEFWSKECLKNDYLCLHTKCLTSIKITGMKILSNLLIGFRQYF